MGQAVFEALEKINTLHDRHDRGQAIINTVNYNNRFLDVLYYGLSPKVNWQLPEGEPPYKSVDEGVTTHGNFWSEVRRLYMYVEGGQNFDDKKRQTLFIQSLEYVHPKDAEILLAMKDYHWPFDHITADLVEEVYPGLLSQVVIKGGQRVNGV